MAKKPTAKATKKPKRKFLSQKDVPAHSLEDALKVPQAIFENYAGDPTEPIDVAEVLGQAPKGTSFKMLTGAAIAYGLIDGGAQSDTINATSLAEKIFRPTIEGDEIAGKREAFLMPRVIGEFLNKYNKSTIPTSSIGINVLEKMGVPRNRGAEIFKTITEGAKELGLVKEINNKTYIRLRSDGLVSETVSNSNEDNNSEQIEGSDTISSDAFILANSDPKPAEIISGVKDEQKSKRVFITHGKNKTLVEPIKQLLAFGELEAVVSVEKQSVSQPVPDKVMDDMRSCGAAIIHVEGEETLLDKDGEQRIVLNPNVLIEIGAAMALYKKRFILLTKDGVKLPSNLQGLYEVRYSDDALDGDATIRLLKAINEMKKTK